MYVIKVKNEEYYIGLYDEMYRFTPVIEAAQLFDTPEEAEFERTSPPIQLRAARQLLSVDDLEVRGVNFTVTLNP